MGPAPGLLPRAELLGQLAAGFGKTTLLLGPPGSGKSTALSQLSCQMLAGNRAVARLTLSARHNEVEWLRMQLEEIFCSGTPGSGDEMPAISPGTFGLVDGLEHLHTPAALALMDSFLLGVPADAALIATALQLRGAALHDGRMRGLVRVFGAEHLRLHDEEAALLLGPGYSSAQVSRINRFVEGWAAGLRFFAEDGAAAPAPGPQMTLPAGLAGYFDEVVCARIDPAMLAMLSELAVLDRFTAPLVADLPDAPYSWPLLETLLLTGFFLHYTDAARHWVAFQPAFGQHLCRRFRLCNPERYQQLQCFSAAWFEQHGFGAEAVRHAVELPDSPMAARIIERAGAINVDINDGPDAALADFLPPTRAAELPLLFMAQTYQRIRQGRQSQAEAAFDQAWELTAGFTKLHGDSDADMVRTWAHMLKVMFLLIRDIPVDQASIDLLTEQMRTHQVQHPVLAGGIASILALIYLDTSRYPQAAAVCAAGLALQPQPLVSKAAIWIGQHQTSVMLAHGSVAQARQCVEDVWRLAHIEAQPDSYEVLTTQLLWGIVLYEDDQADAAMALIEPALQQIRRINGWVRLYAESYSTAAAIAGSRHGWDAAEGEIRAGEAFACERNLPRLTQFLATLRVRELVRSRHYETAKKCLDAPLMAGLLGSDERSDHHLVIRVPALLEAAALMLQLGQAREALGYLQRIDAGFIERADARLQLRHHLLHLRAYSTQRRWAAAINHLCSATAVVRRSGLQRQFREDASTVNELRKLLSSSTRGLPNEVSDYLDRILPAAAPTSALDASAAGGAGRVSSARMDGTLSPRESQIMLLIAEGLINKEIATRLGISEGTVKTHRKKIHEKLGVSTRSKAIMRARERMII